MQTTLSQAGSPTIAASASSALGHARWPLTAAILLAVLALAWFVTVRQSVLFVIGIGMGGLLAGARFGFTTGWRRLIEARDASGVFAQIVLLAVAAAISIPLLAKFPATWPRPWGLPASAC